MLKATRSHEAANEMLKFAQESMDSAVEAFQAALTKYKAGKEGMFQEVSNALQQLAAARLSYSQVKTEWLTSLAMIAYATGTITTPQEAL